MRLQYFLFFSLMVPLFIGSFALGKTEKGEEYDQIIFLDFMGAGKDMILRKAVESYKRKRGPNKVKVIQINHPDDLSIQDPDDSLVLFKETALSAFKEISKDLRMDSSLKIIIDGHGSPGSSSISSDSLPIQTYEAEEIAKFIRAGLPDEVNRIHVSAYSCSSGLGKIENRNEDEDDIRLRSFAENLLVHLNDQGITATIKGSSGRLVTFESGINRIRTALDSYTLKEGRFQEKGKGRVIYSANLPLDPKRLRKEQIGNSVQKLDQGLGFYSRVPFLGRLFGSVQVKNDLRIRRRLLSELKHLESSELSYKQQQVSLERGERQKVYEQNSSYYRKEIENIKIKVNFLTRHLTDKNRLHLDRLFTKMEKLEESENLRSHIDLMDHDLTVFFLQFGVHRKKWTNSQMKRHTDLSGNYLNLQKELEVKLAEIRKINEVSSPSMDSTYLDSPHQSCKLPDLVPNIHKSSENVEDIIFKLKGVRTEE